MKVVSRAELASSQRPEGDWRELDTTPEFRQFVAKKLDELVESMIKEKDVWQHLPAASMSSAAADGGSVSLFTGGPPLEVREEEEAPPPTKRPRLSGVDLQRYQLKKKARNDRLEVSAGDSTNGQKAAPPDTSSVKVAQPDDTSSVKVAPPVQMDGTTGGGEESDSSEDEDMARFAEAAVPQAFIDSLEKSRTVKLDSK